ncbi:Tn3 family transposase [Streptomyces sp. NPDC052069]|uniref:Tn3 family transposase n=1 Tax=Streptomyces sp. NPDC052069 TaxID=3154650 RepID=UPI00343485B7
MFTECPCGTAPPWTSRPTALTRTGSRHGQSEIGFGITRLLNLDLLPRIKRISKVRLYRPVAGEPDAYPQLTPALARLIRRELIARQYDEMFNMRRPGRPDRSPRSITELVHPCARRRPRTADAVPGLRPPRRWLSSQSFTWIRSAPWGRRSPTKPSALPSS